MTTETTETTETAQQGSDLEAKAAALANMLELISQHEASLNYLLKVRDHLQAEIRELGLEASDVERVEERPARQSGYLMRLAEVLHRGDMELIEPTAHDNYTFSKVIEKYADWLKGLEAANPDEPGNAPTWATPDPAMTDEELNDAVRLMALQLIAEGSAMRKNPTPRGWLLAHLLDSIGEVLSDWVAEQDPDRETPLDVDHAHGWAIVSYLAMQLGLHEVGWNHMADAIRQVVKRWSQSDAAAAEHALIYRMLVWEERQGDVLSDLREAGLLDSVSN